MTGLRRFVKRLAASVLGRQDDDRVQTELASYEQVKRFHLIPEEFSQDNDLLTPTLKLKRIKILERYQDSIKAMYAE